MITSTQLEIGKKVPRHPLGYAYYFFRYLPIGQLELHKAVRCLVAQLIIQQAEKNDKTPVSLQTSGPANAQGASEANLDESLDILQNSFDLFGETILILDGLDLCTDDVIRNISRIIQTAIKRNCKVRLVALSRISMDVEDAIADRPPDTSNAFQWTIPDRSQDTSNGFQWTRHGLCALIPRKKIAQDIDTCLLAEMKPIMNWLRISANTTWPSDGNLPSMLARNSNGKI